MQVVNIYAPVEDNAGAQDESLTVPKTQPAHLQLRSSICSTQDLPRFYHPYAIRLTEHCDSIKKSTVKTVAFASHISAS